MPSRIAKILLSLTLLVLTVQLSAQADSKIEVRQIIAGVSVEGNRFVDEATIIAISGLRVGQELNPRSEDVPQAIKGLWQRKQFADVRITMDRITALGVFLKIIVKENPRYSSFEVIGNDKVSIKNIADSIHHIVIDGLKIRGNNANVTFPLSLIK